MVPSLYKGACALRTMVLLLLLVTGLGLFFVGLRLMTHTFQQWAGERMGKLLLRYTSRPVVGVASGLVAAAVLQSSSATNIIVVTLMGAGLLKLQAAFSVILGANIGTTVTAHLAALPLSDHALTLLIVGVALGLPNPERFRLAFVGRILAALGAIFYGLSVLALAFAPLLTGSWLEVALVTMANAPLASVTVGMLLTAIVQSSSLVTTAAVGLASQGLVPAQAAIAVALGSNVGTVATTLLASAWQNAEAKRAALADLLFNVLGVLIILPFFHLFVQWVTATADDPGRQVANAHTLFNVVTAAVALPFIPQLCQLIRRWTGRLDSL